MSTKDKIMNRLKGFYTTEYLACTKCGHPKENHWWNGGGNPDRSGYDACHSCDCNCMSKGVVVKEIEYRSSKELI